MIDVTEIDFEGSTVKQFFKQGNELHLVLEQVFFENSFYVVTIIFQNVSSIKTDARMTAKNCMPAEDGEIISLKLEPKSATFVIEWNNFKKQLQFSHGYEIAFDEYRMLLNVETL